MKHALGLAIMAFLFPRVGAAQLQVDLDKPYDLHVVLHVADNRYLTPVFQDRLQLDLRDQLQLALGWLARVEVVRTHPLLPEIEAKGLDSALDAWNQVSSLKTHFVLVDFAQGVYTLQARQHDGMTGLLSPAVRRAQTSDRGQVAQTAARLVEQDFGVAGTVTEVDKDIQIALKGGKLAAHRQRSVKPGEVFALSRITKEGEITRGRRVPWALLEVLEAPRDGLVRCRLWHRFQQDDLRPLPGVLGYRCLKIATSPGPLKIRLIDDVHFGPLAGLQVHVLRPGDKKPAELTTNRDGLAVTRGRYEQMVLVRVVSGDTVRAQLPVELMGERTVVCRLKSQPEAEALSPLEFRKDLWLRRMLDSLRLASERVAHLNQELNKSLEGALQTARNGLKNMEEDHTVFTLERAEIQSLAGQRKVKIDLRDGDSALGELRKKQQDLERFITRVESVLKEARNAEELGLARLLERARLLEAEADFEPAIALYDRVLAASPDQAKVKEHVDKLKAAWAPRSAKHAEARLFLVQTWPKLDVAELKKHLDQAKAALAVCKEAQDRLTPLRMIRANVTHVARLTKHLETLRGQESEDNRNQAKDLLHVVEGLRLLHAEASATAGLSKKE